MLPSIPAPREQVTVGGVSVSVRGLTVGECRLLQKLETEDAERTGVQALAWGCDVTIEEAEAWVEATSPQFGAEVAAHIMRLSGLGETEGARFPEGVPNRNGGDRRLRTIRPSEKAASGDTGHAEQ